MTLRKKEKKFFVLKIAYLENSKINGKSIRTNVYLKKKKAQITQ